MTTATSQTAVQEILARPEPNPIVLTVIVQFERFPGVEAGGELWEERFTYRNDGVGVKRRIESLIANNPRYEGVRLADWKIIEPANSSEEIPDEF